MYLRLPRKSRDFPRKILGRSLSDQWLYCKESLCPGLRQTIHDSHSLAWLGLSEQWPYAVFLISFEMHVYTIHDINGSLG